MNWVKAFAHRLKTQHLDVFLDGDEIQPGDHIPATLSRALERATHVLFVCTPQFLRRALTPGTGVFYEFRIALTEMFYEPSRRLFMPVLREGNARDSIPLELLGLPRFDFRGSDWQKTQLPRLLEHLGHTGYKRVRTCRGSPTPMLTPRRLLTASGFGTALRCIDWSQFLDLLEGDRYAETPDYFTKNGWSKSFATIHVPAVYPDQAPPSGVSPQDSITATHWALRGLVSLRTLAHRYGLDPGLVDRIDRACFETKQYLDFHWNDSIGAAGPYRPELPGPTFSPDVRHTITWLKACRELGILGTEQFRKGSNYCIRFFGARPREVYTLAEFAWLLSLLRLEPDSRPPDLSIPKLRNLTEETEAAITSHPYVLELPGTNRLLFSEPRERHFAPFETWWVIDAAGDLLSNSGNSTVRKRFAFALSTLARLLVRDSADSAGWSPVLLDHSVDPGFTAHVGDILLRFSNPPLSLVQSIMRLIVTRCADLDVYPRHYLLWAIPTFLKMVGERIGT